MGKNVHATIPKGNMGYNQYTVADTAAVELACENIRFSTLVTAGDVSRGGTSATQRQKSHTDEVKYVRNPVRSPAWSKE